MRSGPARIDTIKPKPPLLICREKRHHGQPPLPLHRPRSRGLKQSRFLSHTKRLRSAVSVAGETDAECQLTALTSSVKLPIHLPFNRLAGAGPRGAQGGQHRRECGVAHGGLGPAGGHVSTVRARPGGAAMRAFGCGAKASRCSIPIAGYSCLANTCCASGSGVNGHCQGVKTDRRPVPG